MHITQKLVSDASAGLERQRKVYIDEEQNEYDAKWWNDDEYDEEDDQYGTFIGNYNNNSANLYDDDYDDDPYGAYGDTMILQPDEIKETKEKTQKQQMRADVCIHIHVIYLYSYTYILAHYQTNNNIQNKTTHRI